MQFYFGEIGHTVRLANPHIFSVTWRSRSDSGQSVTDWSGLADLTDVTLVSDDTFRRLGTWVTHDHLSSVIDEDDDT